MAVLYRKPHYNEGRYIEVVVYDNNLDKSACLIKYSC